MPSTRIKDFDRRISYDSSGRSLIKAAINRQNGTHDHMRLGCSAALRRLVRPTLYRKALTSQNCYRDSRDSQAREQQT
jgi:hypothetical protein